MNSLVKSIAGVIGFVSAILGILGFQDTGSLLVTLANIRAYLLGNILVLSMAIGVLSFSISAAFLRYAPISVKEYLLGIPVGAVVLFPNRDARRYVNVFHKLLRKAKSIDIVGIANSQLTEREWPDELKNAIRDGALVRFLFLDPDGTQIGLREKEEGLAKGTLSAQVKTHVGHLNRKIEEFSKENAKTRTQVQYAFYDRYPSHNVMVIDDKHVFYQPYFFSLIGRESPIYYVGSQNAQEAKKIVDEFEQLWKLRGNQGDRYSSQGGQV